MAPPRKGEGDRRRGRGDGGGGGRRVAAPSPSAEGGAAPAPTGRGSITLAAIAGAHGVRGEVRLKLFAESLESLRRHPTLRVGGTERMLVALREGKSPVARFEGIADRAAAEALRGALVEIDRAQLPPLAEGEYYHADLIGLAVFDREAAAVGTVAGVENYGAGDLLDIALGDGRTALVPFRPGIAELADNRIVIDRDFLA